MTFTENEIKDVLTSLYQDGHVDLVLADRVAALMKGRSAAPKEEHLCVFCHHRWTGDGGAEHCGDCHRECLKLRTAAVDPPKDTEPSEEITPHAFHSRTRYEPGDDRDIWCKDCEYHRDHPIHGDVGDDQ